MHIHLIGERRTFKLAQILNLASSLPCGEDLVCLLYVFLHGPLRFPRFFARHRGVILLFAFIFFFPIHLLLTGSVVIITVFQLDGTAVPCIA